MDPKFQTSRVMHEEHVAVLALLERLANAMRDHNPQSPPDPLPDSLMRLLRELPAVIEGEVGRHFDFEEQHLFDLMIEAGDKENVDLLVEQHDQIRPVGTRLAVLARDALGNGFSSASWAEFSALADEYVDRLGTHAQLEEATMVPLLDDILEPEQDNELAETYRAMP